jgi:hypothetical protein
VYVFEIGTWRQLWHKDLRLPHGNALPRVTIVDTTKGSIGRLVVTTSPVEQPSWVRVWSGEDWRLRSEQKLGIAATQASLSSDLDGDGDEELVLMGNYPSTHDIAAPTQLAIASWVGDRYQFEYHHQGNWGSVNKGVVADIDNDQRPEFLFSSDTLVQANAIAVTTKDMDPLGPRQRVFVALVRR